jgi:hypothetical protein
MLRHPAMGPTVALAMIAALAGRAIAQSPAPVVTSPTVPPDVSIPAGFPGNPIAFFDDYCLEPTTGTCSSIRVGLVGIHIVQKTPTRPQWIWTSFEHVDNVPGDVNVGHGPFTFNDGTGTAMPASDPYPLDRVLTPPVPPAFNVTRVMPINSSTVATNAAYQAALPPNSIWKNYRLVMTQWPLVPSSPGTDGLPANTFPGLGATSAFANTTLETFDQRSIFTGCMACHNSTRQPTDFVWSLNDHAFTGAITSHAIRMKNPAFRKLRELLELNKNHPEQLERLDPKR